jgi:pimeloyl-ACP methyl ester carboxylesterase
LCLTLGALVLAVTPTALRFTQALAILANLTGAPLPAALERRCLHADIAEDVVSVHLASGDVRAHRYVARAAPDGARRALPGVVLLHGMHAQGIKEPRLVNFARALARAGLDVLTPELADLTAFRLDPRSVDEIRGLAAAHAQTTHSAAVGVIGISFAGGLSLLAAAQQAAATPIGWVAAVGAHDDLLRLARYYAGEPVQGPAGEPATVTPHPYGARVMLREQLAQLVPAADLPVANSALDSYLHDRPREAQHLAKLLSPAGRSVMATVLAHGAPDAQLAGFLNRVVPLQSAQLMAASPHGHLGNLQVPVFLLHGADDPIIPSLETAYLAQEVPPGYLRAKVVTKLLRHAEFPQPFPLLEAYQLARFMQRLLEAAHCVMAVAPGQLPAPAPSNVLADPRAHAQHSLR